jgi:CPA2 family monovalent cation:H+ antiporter-2
MALGAFLAGLMFSETEYRHEITVDIQPFRGLLLGLFFVSVGMGIDMAEVAARPVWLASSVIGLFMVKGVILYVLASFSGQSPSVSLEASLLLGQGGEFAFVVLGMAAGLGLMPRDVAQFMLIVTGLTMMATPLVARLARQLARLVERLEAQRGQSEPDPRGTLSGHVVVVGYGRVGQLLGSILDEQEVPHIAIDNDALLVARFRQKGANIYFGDANRTELLRRLGIEEAAALVVTMDDAELAERVVDVAHRSWPRLPIYCRARDPDHAARLLHRGATRVIPEAMEATLQLGEAVLQGAGIPEDAARQLIEIRREELQAVLELEEEEKER